MLSAGALSLGAEQWGQTPFSSLAPHWLQKLAGWLCAACAACAACFAADRRVARHAAAAFSLGEDRRGQECQAEGERQK